jgi:hypothetical protein
MDGGPWVFRGKSVLIEPYDGFTRPSMIELRTILMWIQIHDLPDGYKGLVKTLAGKVGKFVEQEVPLTDFVGNFYRLKVKIDVYKQLKSVVLIFQGGKRELFLVKYERLPDWCSVCGMLGHVSKEHADGVHDSASEIFKNLHTDFSWRLGARATGRGRGRGGRGRHGGWGGNTADAWEVYEDLIPDENSSGSGGRYQGVEGRGRGRGATPFQGKEDQITFTTATRIQRWNMRISQYIILYCVNGQLQILLRLCPLLERQEIWH